jgi:hypothetical protein
MRPGLRYNQFEIITSHVPPVVFYNRIDPLSIPRVEINPSPLLLIALGSATLSYLTLEGRQLYPCVEQSVQQSVPGEINPKEKPCVSARSTLW